MFLRDKLLSEVCWFYNTNGRIRVVELAHEFFMYLSESDFVVLEAPRAVKACTADMCESENLFSACQRLILLICPTLPASSAPVKAWKPSKAAILMLLGALTVGVGKIFLFL